MNGIPYVFSMNWKDVAKCVVCCSPDWALKVNIYQQDTFRVIVSAEMTFIKYYGHVSLSKQLLVSFPMR